MKRLIIDVRETGEYSSGHVDGAINIPPSKLMEGAPELNNVDKDTQLILYCRSGSRSQVSKHLLEQQGFTDVVNGINQANVKQNFLSN